VTTAARASRISPLIGTLVVATAYVLTAILGQVAGRAQHAAIPIWAPGGIAIAGLIILGTGAWPGVLVGSFIANLIIRGQPGAAALMSLGNAAAALFAAEMVLRFARGLDTFDRAQDVLRWTVYAAILASAISATAGAAARFGFGDWPTYLHGWLAWWISNVNGALVVAPPLLLWWRHPAVKWSLVRILEGLIFALSLLLVAAVVFGVPGSTTFDPTQPRAFLLFPIMAWAAFRLGARTSATMMLGIAALATWATIAHRGPFFTGDLPQSLALVQTFLATVAATTLVLTAAVHESHRAQRTAEQSEWRARFLTEASAKLSESLDIEKTLAAFAQLAVPRITDWCAIRLVQDDGSIRQIALATTNEAGHSRLDRFLAAVAPDKDWPQPYMEVIRTGKSLLIPEITDAMLRQATHTPAEFELARSLGMRSTITVPLVASSGIPGAMTLASCGPDRRYGPADLGLAEELGRRVGIAVENARLFARSQDAIRSREDFLAIASHELRTPVTSLRLQVQIVERALNEELAHARQSAELADGADGLERVIGLIGVLGDDSRRLVRLVGGLLDVTRIASGQLDLQPDDLDFREVVRGGIDSMRPELSARHVPLTFDAPEPIPGRWDRLRLEQIVANLLSNAIKYGEGKPVDIRAFAEGDQVVLTVEDQGQGIEPAFVDRMFERFERGTTGTQGLGLGLYITRQIVESHGGTIEVLNRPGAGVTFTVRLPRIFSQPVRGGKNA
jgi:signal transduction histidine kinase/integral membrane sensor domain MASE1